MTKRDGLLVLAVSNYRSSSTERNGEFGQNINSFPGNGRPS